MRVIGWKDVCIRN